ncbi:rod outer segment membrane protein 1-like [Onthophagus taurus]|uniref:rod outer segment membrane protein 1-like n=1 Tax=Onthophagus taurus TaxID=166361 RepID=UPI000C2087BA|nr:rod outer segment membrane protein 1-like [Onthophagus taurus]
MQQTTVKVKCGKPVFKFKFRTLRAIGIVASLMCGAIFLYNLNLVYVAFHIRYNIGVYIDMLSANGRVLPMFLVITALAISIVDICVMFYLGRAFSKTKNKHINFMLFVIVLVIIGSICFIFFMCILILSHSYSKRQQMHDGIVDAMMNYSKDSLTKETLDNMQVEYECCGSKNYSDWYDIKWYDANLINTGKFPSLKGEAPFSCCAIQSVYPCIHHGIEVAADAYLYKKDANISVSTEGCHTMILKKREACGWTLVLRLFGLAFLQTIVLIGMRLVQTGHSERKSFDREERLYTCWLFGCYAGKTKSVVPPPVPPLPPELLE